MAINSTMVNGGVQGLNAVRQGVEMLGAHSAASAACSLKQAFQLCLGEHTTLFLRYIFHWIKGDPIAGLPATTTLLAPHCADE